MTYQSSTAKTGPASRFCCIFSNILSLPTYSAFGISDGHFCMTPAVAWWEVKLPPWKTTELWQWPSEIDVPPLWSISSFRGLSGLSLLNSCIGELPQPTFWLLEGRLSAMPWVILLFSGPTQLRMLHSPCGVLGHCSTVGWSLQSLSRSSILKCAASPKR